MGYRLLLGALLVCSANSMTCTAQEKADAGAAPFFEVATIKPSDPSAQSGTYFTVKGSHVLARNVTLEDLISLAYAVHPKQIVDGPAWLETERFDLDGVPNTEGKPNRAQMRLLFQRLLADRFQLSFHHQKRELAVYTLTVDRSGPKMAVTNRTPTDGTNFSYAGSVILTVKNASMADFADGMQDTFMDRPVVDQTELKGRYDFILRWTPTDSPAGNDANAPPDLYTAIREQLGLKLAATKAPVDALVIDRVEKPSPN